MDANDTRRIADDQRGPPLQHEDARRHSNPSDRKLAYGNRCRGHAQHQENEAKDEINQGPEHGGQHEHDERTNDPLPGWHRRRLYWIPLPPLAPPPLFFWRCPSSPSCPAISRFIGSLSRICSLVSPRLL